MSLRSAELSPRGWSRIAGLGYLVIIISGILAEFVLRGGLTAPGDAAATANRIMASESLFRLSIAGDLVMLICDAVVALALYVLLRQVSRNLALLATFFRLVHTAILGANLLNLFFVIFLLGGASYLAGIPSGQLPALAQLFLEAHGIGYTLGLVFFGVHCLILGYLVFKAGFMPRVLGILLVVAGAGYLLDSFVQVLLSNYADFELVFALAVFIPAFVGELTFCLWLLFKGVTTGKTA